MSTTAGLTDDEIIEKAELAAQYKYVCIIGRRHSKAVIDLLRGMS